MQLLGIIICVPFLYGYVAGHALKHYNSELHFRRLIYLESELITFCRTVLEQEQLVHHQERDHFHDYLHIQEFLLEAEDNNEWDQDNEHHIVGNPLAVFHLRRRLAKQWPKILEDITQCSMVTIMPSINDQLKRIREILIRDTNMEASIADVIRLQLTYDIPIKHILEGWFGPTRTEPMSLEDILDISLFLGEHEQNEAALSWLLQGVMEATNTSIIADQKLRVMGILARMYTSLEQYDNAVGVHQKILTENPESKSAKRNLQFLQTKLDHATKQAELREIAKEEGKVLQSNKVVDTEHKTGEQDWMKYCRGEYLQKGKQSEKLDCHVKDINHLTVDSADVEELHRNPRVVRIHNLLQEDDLHKLKQSTEEQIWEKMINYKNFHDEHSATFYADTQMEDYWLQRIIQRMRNITIHERPVYHPRLMNKIKVCNHGAGGSDYPIVEENIHKFNGPAPQPIARYIIFLNDDAVGGDIVFPHLQLRVPAIKNTALFWQFRKPREWTHEKLQYFIECPVIVGSQWTAKILVEHMGILQKIEF